MTALKLIVGLGNPGKQYQETRHNIGFKVVEKLVQSRGKTQWSSSRNFDLAEAELGEASVKVMKPQTFMNRSGEAVAEIMRFYKYRPDELVVVHDELDLPFGRLRLKAGGGDAGNNGLRSITECLGSSDYLRLRFGIGKPESSDQEMTSWVLGKFSQEESKGLDDLISRACSALADLNANGLKAAQNKFNAA